MGEGLHVHGPTVFLDLEVFPAKIRDRLIVAIERDDVQLDEVARQRRGLLALSGGDPRNDCQGRGDKPGHASAFRMTVIAVSVSR
jgi:hypothetical protein